MPTHTHMIVAGDFTELTDEAFSCATDLASKRGALVHLIHFNSKAATPQGYRRHLATDPRTVRREGDFGQNCLLRRYRELEEHKVPSTKQVVHDGEPAEAILRTTRRTRTRAIYLNFGVNKRNVHHVANRLSDRTDVPVAFLR